MDNATPTFINRLHTYLTNTSYFTWIIVGFSLSYWLFFITPVFLNSDQTMKFMESVQSKHAIGEDLYYSRRASELQFIKGVSPYVDNNHYAYPPFDLIAFSPLLLAKASKVYPLFTLINVACFIFLTLFIPMMITKIKHPTDLLLLILGTGLFSYGLQFELERGQFNIIATTICFLSIWIYHYRPQHRLLAYILFSVSVQLKLFPLIFILMFVDDWADWKNNIKRLASLTIINFVLLLILGKDTFLEFIKALHEQATNPYIWVGNHSITSFASQLSTWAMDNHAVFPINSNILQTVLISLVAISLLLIIIQTHGHKIFGVNAYLLLACTIASLLIPSSSHDYKLSILAAPAVIFLSSVAFDKNVPTSIWFTIPLITFFSFLYSSTLFSYTNKPYYLDNNLPALLLMLFIVVVFSFINKIEYQADTL